MEHAITEEYRDDILENHNVIYPYQPNPVRAALIEAAILRRQGPCDPSLPPDEVPFAAIQDSTIRALLSNFKGFPSVESIFCSDKGKGRSKAAPKIHYEY